MGTKYNKSEVIIKQDLELDWVQSDSGYQGYGEVMVVKAAVCPLKVLQFDHAIFAGCLKSSKTSEASRDKAKNKSP